MTEIASCAPRHRQTAPASDVGLRVRDLDPELVQRVRDHHEPDRAVEAYLNQEGELPYVLTVRERKHLEGPVRKLLASLDPSAPI